MPSPTLPAAVPAGKIRLYCVGIYFYNDIDFVADPMIEGAAGVQYMAGGAVLAKAAALGLRYSTSKSAGHVEFLSFTPQTASPFRHPTEAAEFPYYGMPLSLQEVQAPIGSISTIFQYTCDRPVAKPLVGNPQFAVNGFQDGSEIRIRLLSIYDSAPLYN